LYKNSLVALVKPHLVTLFANVNVRIRPAGIITQRALRRGAAGKRQNGEDQSAHEMLLQESISPRKWRQAGRLRGKSATLFRLTQISWRHFGAVCARGACVNAD
jgi:hypothetical protein